MKKKGLILLAAITMAFVLAACGGGDGGTTAGGSTQTSQGESQDGFVFTAGSTKVAMNVPAADILAALGEPQDKYEAESCAFQGMDRTYTYPGYTIDTYENNGVETILYVTFKDDTVSTAEGLSIGENIEKAKELYGDGGTDNGSSLSYTKGASTLVILYGGDGAITQIQYGAVVK